MQTYTNDIELQPNHSYFHKEVGNVLSVTTILNGGKTSNAVTPAMESGTAIHKVIELFLKGRKTEAKVIYNELDSTSQSKVKALVEELKQLDIAGSSSELSFVTEDNSIKFGGTVDLLTSNVAIDFKTGGFNNKYPQQIAAYAVANSKKQGLILSFKGASLEKVILNNQEIETYYKEFTQKAKNLLGVKSPFDLKMAQKLDNFSRLKQAYESLGKQLELEKVSIETDIKQAGYTKFELGNFKAYEVKARETTSLTKEAKSTLLQTNPEYFEIKASKPSFVIREG